MLRLSRFILLFALIAALSANAGAGAGTAFQGATPAGCPEASPATNETIVNRWYDDVLSGHDIAVLDEILSPGIVLDAAAFPENPHPGLIIEQLLAGFPDLDYTVNDVISSDDKVVVRWTASGTNDGEFMGNPPTGNRATWTGINIFQVECGLITRVWSEIDAVSRSVQLSVLPGEPAGATPAP